MSEFAFDRTAKVYVAGHGGLVGSAIWRELRRQGFENLVGWRSSELDLRDQNATRAAVLSARPDVVILAAAKVGGILANASEPTNFLNDNLRIQTNVFEAAHEAGVEKLLFLGSSCIYPKFASQPISESSLLTGELESTNEAYAIAKIAGIMAVKAFRQQYGHHWISAMPTNLYGPGDNFDLNRSHVLPAMIRKFHEARQSGSAVTLWGSGAPRREFLHVDDLASAVIFLLRTYDSDQTINVGTGVDVTIRELAELVSRATRFEGEIFWDRSKPDGTPRKLLDVSRLRGMGWQPTIGLSDGIRATYEWYVDAAA